MLVNYFLMMDQIEYTMEGKRKCIPKFADCKATLDTLSTNETKIQEEKVKQFLQIVAASLTNHFGMWISKDLLSLSLFSEQKIAKRVVRHPLGTPFINGENSVSVIQDKSIDVAKFNQFLDKYYTQNKVMAIHNSLLYTNTVVPSQLIASSCNICHTNIMYKLLLFSDLYQSHYYSLPSNSQFIDRGVIESGYVILWRHSENNHFALAIARAKIIPDTMAAGIKLLKNAIEKISTRKIENQNANWRGNYSSIINWKDANQRPSIFGSTKTIHNDLITDERQLKNNKLTNT